MAKKTEICKGTYISQVALFPVYLTSKEKAQLQP